MSRASLLPRILGIVVGTLLGIYYIGFEVVRWAPFDDDVRVSAQVPRSAGLFEESEVTYRGVTVGRVSEIAVSPGGVRLELRLTTDQEIPAAVDARVRMLSALGEAYVDLVPSGAAEPVLGDGDTIASASVPTNVSDALASGSRLLRSIDPADIETLQTLLADGFSGLAPQLRMLVVAGQRLMNAVTAAAPGTQALITDGLAVLRTGNATQEELAQIVGAFDVLSEQLAAEDEDVETLLRDGGEAATAIEELVRTQSGPFRELLSGAGAVGTALRQNAGAIGVLFDLLPRVTTDLSKVASGEALRGQLTINVGQPMCSYRPLGLPDTEGGADPRACDQGPRLLQRGPD